MLYLPKEIFEQHINQKARCFNAVHSGQKHIPRSKLLTDSSSRKLIEKADVVIFAKLWRAWEFHFLRKSHAELTSEFGNKFLYYKTTNTSKNAKSFDVRYKSQFQSHPIIQPSKTNKRLLATLENVWAYNEIACEYYERELMCPLTTKEGQLIQFDGLHFTREALLIRKNMTRTNTKSLFAYISPGQHNSY